MDYMKTKIKTDAANYILLVIKYYINKTRYMNNNLSLQALNKIFTITIMLKNHWQYPITTWKHLIKVGIIHICF